MPPQKRITSALLKYPTRWRVPIGCKQTQQQIIKLFTHLANISRSLAKFSEREKETSFSSRVTALRQRKREATTRTASAGPQRSPVRWRLRPSVPLDRLLLWHPTPCPGPPATWGDTCHSSNYPLTLRSVTSEGLRGH